MRLISARQAWQDAYHIPGASVMAKAIEDAEEATRKTRAKRRKKLVARFPEGYQGESKEPEGLLPIDSQIIAAYETQTGRAAGNLNRCQHMLAAGKVMHAISTLPKPLQHLGHTLYSPLATGDDVAIAHGLVWIGSGLGQLTQRQGERAYWMALAAINSHKRAVNGRDTLRPGEVCLFIEERLGCRIDPGNWARDYASTWEHLARHIDRLDAQALVPVADVVAKEQGWRRGPGWRWHRVDRDVVAVQRAEAYAERRDHHQQRLAERLRGMSDQQLARWAARMKRYGEAYREEWGEDILECPSVHQRYHDRVAAYWAQRERLKRVA
ncbi:MULTISPECIES: hypothetical protein [Pseudomonas aeruginosa group]|uniref:hypothetical protein n=1 Tax=Pseudomonas aeruginosa group TaxID=136841 RepID=UPI0006B29015|nr:MULTISPECIES: hypothetical protein [Pseudomonas aeruginosa group]KPD29200.1 hypothetical protein AN920_11855 [Pseudomonas paraeruginosa]KQB32315.1 hypothetical protein AOA77_13305 [Pseudomonas paraeruginosa]MDT1024160.1 hypothetical protein [Pseudomonas paraeruginosa]PHJ33561.1 hypothetical protein CDG78_04420 [Pseudomonas paraeruginosa]QQV51107.1 hypothetical protein JHW37_12515 [Pseudomonas aeruginosa]